jgi:hypothetical protein
MLQQSINEKHLKEFLIIAHQLHRFHNEHPQLQATAFNDLLEQRIRLAVSTYDQPERPRENPFPPSWALDTKENFRKTIKGFAKAGQILQAEGKT